MKKSDLKNYIRENIISTLEEDIAADTKALEDYESKLDDERNKVLKCVSIQENSSIKGQQGEEFTFHQLNLLLI